VTPAVFAEFTEVETPKEFEIAASPSLPLSSAQSLAPIQEGPMRVTLLGYTQPMLDDRVLLEHHGSAVFLFEGISRTCTHQLVRHRLGSFSQESQRYIDLTKGGWNAIVPEEIAKKPEAMAVLADFWNQAETKYAELRSFGIRKEDARFLLPNAAETRIITTMNFAAWSHFFWLRAVDKAAQWEIRAMGQHALKMLYTIAPAVFQKHWEVYQERFGDRDASNIKHKT
jgi:thymidylate synthase (FAD)